MKIKLNIVIISALLVTFGCKESDEGLNDVDRSQLIMAIAGSDSKTWDVDQAFLTNSGTENLDVSSAFNIMDDEIIFSEGDNSSASIEWRRRYAMNFEAISLEEFYSDQMQSAQKDVVMTTLDEDNSLRAIENNWKFTYQAESKTLLAEITWSETTDLRLVLSEKQSADYLRAPSVINNGELLFEVEEVIFWSGLTFSRATQNLYVSNLGVLENPDQWVMRYNVVTADEEFFYLPKVENNHPSTRLEIFNNTLINALGNKHQQYSLDLDPLNLNYNVPQVFGKFAVSAMDEQLYFFGGYFDDYETSKIARFNIGSGVTDIFYDLPEVRREADGEIVDGKLYIFGGDANGVNGYNDVLIYDLDSGHLTNFTIPATIGDTRTSAVENLIYIASSYAEDITGNTSRVYLAAYDTQSNSYQEIPINFEVPDESKLVNIFATRDALYSVFYRSYSATLDGKKIFVYKSELN